MNLRRRITPSVTLRAVLRSLAFLFLLLSPSAHAAVTPPFVSSWGSLGSLPGQFLYPAFCATDPARNRVYVTDDHANTVDVFTQGGGYVTRWGSLGTGNGQFSGPEGIAVDSGGNVYVADWTNARIVKFDANGVAQTPWGSPGSGLTNLQTPQGVACDAANNVYVADRGNNRIMRYTSTGGSPTVIGTTSDHASVIDVAVDPTTGAIYSTDFYGGKVCKYSSAGTLLLTIPMSLPHGIAVDCAGLVYVSDLTTGYISVFNPAGVLQYSFGSGYGGGMYDPVGFTIGKYGQIYVVENGNQRVQWFATPIMPRPASLVGWWKFDETAGTTAADVQAATPLTYAGAPTLATMPLTEKAIHLAGGGDYVNNASPPASLNFGTGDFSIEGWVRSTNAATAVRTVLDHRLNGGGNGFSLYISFGHPGLQISGANVTAATSPSVVDGAWHHLAVSVSRSTNECKIYVDGVAYSTFTPSAASVTNTGPVRVGQATDLSSIGFDGDIDELAVYNTALTASDIAGIYAGSCLGSSKAGLTLQRTKGTLSGAQNCGEYAGFSYTPSTGTATSQEWIVGGDVLKDYFERTDMGNWTTTDMAASDFGLPTVGFYWKPAPTQIWPAAGTAVNRPIFCAVSTTAGYVYAITQIPVERNSTSTTRQPVDFYTSNHCPTNGCAPNTGNGRALIEHTAWHGTLNSCCGATYDGAWFFSFHRLYLDNYKKWLKLFGYQPAFASWCPGSGYPSGQDYQVTGSGSDNRNPSSTPGALPVPTWFTLAGSAAARPTAGTGCDTGAGQLKLKDFATKKLLGCAVTAPWHNKVHGAVGGWMSLPSTAPRDPLFWSWHECIDKIGRDWDNAQGSMFGMRPFSVWQLPHPLWKNLTVFPGSYSLAFDAAIQMPAPGALTVNGQPATALSTYYDDEDSSQVYVFSGYPAPALGPVSVTLTAGSILAQDGTPNDPESYSYALRSPTADDDGDGLSNDEEINTYLTDPDNVDSDGDGASDFVEVQNGTNPLDSPAFTGAGEIDVTPTSTALFAPFPNPVRDRTTLVYAIATAGRVRLDVFDARGRLVQHLADRDLTAKRYFIDWRPVGADGQRLAAGVYSVLLTTATSRLSAPLIIVP